MPTTSTYRFPFGQQVKDVVQKDRSPKKVFVLGVYASAVHPKWLDEKGKLGSGMRNMMLYGKKYGGADPDLVEGDIFRMVISVPEFGANPAVKTEIVQAWAESGAESGAEKILCLLQNQLLSKSEIASQLGLNTVTGALSRTIRQLLSTGMIEYTIPEKPNSRLQKYRLTATGKERIKRGRL